MRRSPIPAARSGGRRRRTAGERPGPCHSPPSPPAYRRGGAGGLQSPCSGGAGCPAGQSRGPGPACGMRGVCQRGLTLLKRPSPAPSPVKYGKKGTSDPPCARGTQAGRAPAQLFHKALPGAKPQTDSVRRFSLCAPWACTVIHCALAP